MFLYIKFIHLVPLFTITFMPNVNLHRTTADTRIVGGMETTIDRVPYLINLRQNGQFSCGGSLITTKCVLTAAHCVYGASPSTLTINAGASKLTDPSEIRQVQQSFVSSFYSPATLDMDVAVLKLREPLMGPNIATIPLCSNRPGNNEIVRVSGWGVTSENNQLPSNQVRTVTIPVVSREECMKAYAGKALITSTMFCASVPGRTGFMFWGFWWPGSLYWTSVRYVSWGFGCGRREFPGVYTNVASLRISAFVKTIVMQNCM